MATQRERRLSAVSLIENSLAWDLFVLKKIFKIIRSAVLCRVSSNTSFKSSNKA